MIDWTAFLIVAVITWIAAIAIVSAYSFGVRLLAVAKDDGSNESLSKTGAYACFVVCGLIVAFGVVLIVPQLSEAILGVSSGH
ncbi:MULTISPECIES: hypothetical protein [Glutamicibacter]|jgi:succinate dehydrogenase/fumarate reductase cytochrome b subunit|uniref:Uncharacterized protein n=2 Tax=Glutamicibacter arilaitensis TaxID=256701 RepID=A0A2N7S3G9_9MICC|nr:MULTISPECIES: hypothetical protein [Glutamicibacter]PMQ20680.1 hypothetical protein CIK84_03530 [Glutamicibacter arilaitensis]TFH56920.1 hypothetical protein EXY26_07885 [Glutamicibacter arilaitensis]CBT76157.1 hypothetical membrane protein [Glutamicibacter arilaitensis Re117]HCH47450.1 hypothetical protein [Glutamicibacter sp.]HCJ54921.1 hypothetical protein [Glutamicibacter sp.]